MSRVRCGAIHIMGLGARRFRSLELSCQKWSGAASAFTAGPRSGPGPIRAANSGDDTSLWGNAPTLHPRVHKERVARPSIVPVLVSCPSLLSARPILCPVWDQSLRPSANSTFFTRLSSPTRSCLHLLLLPFCRHRLRLRLLFPPFSTHTSLTPPTHLVLSTTPPTRSRLRLLYPFGSRLRLLHPRPSLHARRSRLILWADTSCTKCHEARDDVPAAREVLPSRASPKTYW